MNHIGGVRLDINYGVFNILFEIPWCSTKDLDVVAVCALS